MSYYYNYFLGYKNKDDGLYYPLGPYDMNGNLHDVITESRSFDCGLHERFYIVPIDKYSEALKKEYSYIDYDGDTKYATIRYLPVSELPTGSYLKKGYFLFNDIKLYEEYRNVMDLDVFYDWMPESLYVEKMKNEIIFGKPETQFDCEGNELPNHSCSEYAYYMYPDYSSEEYNAQLLRNVLSIYDYGVKELNNAEVVILETEG